MDEDEILLNKIRVVVSTCCCDGKRMLDFWKLSQARDLSKPSSLPKRIVEKRRESQSVRFSHH